MRMTVAAHGWLDVMLSNASVLLLTGSVTDMDLSALDRVMAVNEHLPDEPCYSLYLLSGATKQLICRFREARVSDVVEEARNVDLEQNKKQAN